MTYGLVFIELHEVHYLSVFVKLYVYAVYLYIEV